MANLTDEEIAALREIIEKEKRWKWLFTGSRNVAAWIVGILGGIYVVYEGLIKAVKSLAGT